MVRLHKNNKAGNPYKHYIFCRTSFFRMRSYKDNLPKQIGQAPSKQNNVPHRRRYLIPTGKQGTPLFFTLMLRSRGKKSLTTQGFAGAVFTG